MQSFLKVYALKRYNITSPLVSLVKSSDEPSPDARGEATDCIFDWMGRIQDEV